jgi:hypothetical protein
MKTLFSLLLMVSLFSCTKNSNEGDPDILICPGPTWLDGKKAEYGNCTCAVQFFQSTYNNQTVIEIRGNDPLCNGINAVYTVDGKLLFSSADTAKYNLYRQQAQSMQLIWSCPGPKNN